MLQYLPSLRSSSIACANLACHIQTTNQLESYTSQAEGLSPQRPSGVRSPSVDSDLPARNLTGEECDLAHGAVHVQSKTNGMLPNSELVNTDYDPEKNLQIQMNDTLPDEEVDNFKVTTLEKADISHRPLDNGAAELPEIGAILKKLPTNKQLVKAVNKRVQEVLEASVMSKCQSLYRSV